MKETKVIDMVVKSTYDTMKNENQVYGYNVRAYELKRIDIRLLVFLVLILHFSIFQEQKQIQNTTMRGLQITLCFAFVASCLAQGMYNLFPIRYVWLNAFRRVCLKQ